MTEEELLICSKFIAGYSISDKQWGVFEIDHIRDPEWNDSAFESLILDPVNKEMILSLVRSHSATSAHKAWDFVEGKGGGIVFLLHGDPGLGKTLTAGMYNRDRGRLSGTGN